MMIISTLLALLLYLPGTTLASSEALDYDDQGHWPELCLKGNRQSPIDIKTEGLLYKNKRRPLIRLPTRKAAKATLINNNNLHTIKYEIKPDMKMNVPGIRHKKAELLQLHIHWGRNNTEGSEHRLDGKQFSAETHLVTRYRDNGKIQYAVFARFFKVGMENILVQKMIDAQLSTDEDRNIARFDLTVLYPKTVQRILTYEGSFTTPGCDELAHWVVVPEPLEISGLQLEQLRNLPLGDGSAHHKAYNWRKLQDLNGREITSYQKI